MTLLVAALALLSSLQEPVQLRTELRPTGEVWVGQRVSLYVTVVMAGRPDHSPRFDLPALGGAVFLQAPGSPLLGTEAIAGVEHTTQRFELLLYAQRPGELEVPPVRVRTSLAGEEHTGETGAFLLKARLPEGVDAGTALITTDELRLEQRWDPAPATSVVGQALRREVTVRTRDVLGLAVPPMPVPEIPGLAAYPADPLVEDRMSRGRLTGARTDAVTFVFAAPGTYELPALVYRWWNPETRRLERRELEGVSITVEPDPDAPAPEELVSGSSGVGRWIAILIGALAAGAAWLLRRRLGTRWNAWRARRAAGEAAHFRRLVLACRANDPAAAWRALVAWVGRAAPTDRAPVVGELARSLGRPELEREAEVLQRALLTQGASWSGAALLRELHAARLGLRRTEREPGEEPALNPLRRPPGRSVASSLARGLSR